MKADVPFISDARLEAMADALLAAAVAKGIGIQLPIPVEAIAERVLDLDMDWIDLDDPNVMARVSRQSGLGTCEMSFIRYCMAFQCPACE